MVVHDGSSICKNSMSQCNMLAIQGSSHPVGAAGVCSNAGDSSDRRNQLHLRICMERERHGFTTSSSSSSESI
jgi:hypothetical protein